VSPTKQALGQALSQAQPVSQGAQQLALRKLGLQKLLQQALALQVSLELPPEVKQVFLRESLPLPAPTLMSLPSRLQQQQDQPPTASARLPAAMMRAFWIRPA
jgi:hypothetical protein